MDVGQDIDATPCDQPALACGAAGNSLETVVRGNTRREFVLLLVVALVFVADACRS